MPVAALKTRVKRTIEKRLDQAAAVYLKDDRLSAIDFSEPFGESAFSGPDSVSWRIFKNPVSLFIGGVAAVILEFAEPRVRSGVWDYSSFRKNPVARLKRTGLAAMVTVYGARSVAEKMIEGVARMHGRVAGQTPSGVAYQANDPGLLNWVHATAAFGFLEAYSAYVSPLSDVDRDRFYREGQTAASLYGAVGAPASLAEQKAFFETMLPALEASDIVFEFLRIMKHAPALPQPLQISQHSFVRAAVDLTPPAVRDILGLGPSYGLRPFEGRVVARMGRRAERIMLRSSPPAQACVRLGLPEEYLYPRR